LLTEHREVYNKMINSSWAGLVLIKFEKD